MQVSRQSSSLLVLPSSHSSTPIWRKPSPQEAAVQSSRQSSVLSSLSSSQTSLPSTTPSPQIGIESVSDSDAPLSVDGSVPVLIVPEPSVMVRSVPAVVGSVVGAVVVVWLVPVVNGVSVSASCPSLLEQPASVRAKSGAIRGR